METTPNEPQVQKDYKLEQKRRKLERKLSKASTNAEEKENENGEEKIDFWKVDPFNPGDMPAPLTEESSFVILFPTYREQYLREIWPIVTKQLGNYGIKCVLDLHQGSMTVHTTRRTWDPCAILNARDFIKLLSRSVPYEQAMRVFEDGISSEIIKIGNFTRNKQKFVKRRQRLIGPNGQTLKAVELLTKCYVLVMGSTVAVIGSIDGIMQVRRIVEDCMKNIHPVYHIKELMIKRELAKNQALAEESWDRFLPRFKAKRQKKKTVLKAKKKKTYSPFPPAQTPRKIDKEIETGEYFLKKEQRLMNQKREERIKQAEKSKERQLKREESYQPPVESENVETNNDTDFQSTVENVKTLNKKRKVEQRDSESDYVLPKKRSKSVH